MPEGPRTGRVYRPRAAAALVAAIAATLVAAAIGGCGGGGGESSTSTGTSVSTTPTATTQTTPTKSTTTGTSDGSGGEQAGPHLTIPQVIEAVLTSSDPAKTCGANYVTQRYLSAAYGGKQGCVQAQNPKNAASSVQFGHVINLDTAAPPPRASATAVPKGGLYDGEKLMVTLVRQDGTWKVDGLKSNAPVGP